MPKSKARQLYEAAMWMNLDTVEGRSFEVWWDRVSDFGLDDARQALDAYKTHMRSTLTYNLAQAAVKYSLAGRTFKIESDKVLDAGIDPNDPAGMARKLEFLVNTYGDPMRTTGKLMDEAVDAYLDFEKEYPD